MATSKSASSDVLLMNVPLPSHDLPALLGSLQSMLVLFMRPGAVLFEVFPHKYSTAGSEPLATALGVRYGYASSRSLLAMMNMPLFPSMETCMKWSLCRRYARMSDVELSDKSLEVLITLMLKESLGR